MLILFKYGTISGAVIVFFSFFKSSWFFTGQHPDLYLTLVATVFLGAGIFIKRSSVKVIPAGDSSEMSTDQYFGIEPVETLSKREAAVLKWLHSDKSNKEIADILCIEPSTLKTHINHIYKKLEVKNRRELCAKFTPHHTLSS